MRDVMLDLETYGNTPGSAILSIGAVAFDQKRVADGGIYLVVFRGGADYGLHTDEGTKAWWREQSSAARQVIADAKNEVTSFPLPEALDQLDVYVNNYGGKDCRVWGCGADFDNALIRAAYRAVDVKREPVWAFWNNRCYRTLKTLIPVDGVHRSGTHHNALDDARSQAEHAGRLLSRLTEQAQKDIGL